MIKRAVGFIARVDEGTKLRLRNVAWGVKNRLFMQAFSFAVWPERVPVGGDRVDAMRAFLRRSRRHFRYSVLDASRVDDRVWSRQRMQTQVGTLSLLSSPHPVRTCPFLRSL